jgi:hypothetical protein
MRASTSRITFVLGRAVDTFCEARRLLPVKGSMQATTPSTTLSAIRDEALKKRRRND